MGIAFLGPEHFEVLRFIHSRLNTQNRSRFVIGFDRVGLDAMLDPDAFRAVLEVADDFSFKTGVKLAS